MRICFVCLHAYPLFRPGGDGVFGGSEVRAWTFARELARSRRHEVSFVVLDHGQAPSERVGDVEVIAHQGYPAKPPSPSLLDRLRRRLPRFARHDSGRILGIPVPPERVLTYQRAAAEVYLVFGVSNVAAELALHCGNAGGKLVIFAGSDLDFSATYQPGATTRNVYGSIEGWCRFAIASADRILAQTQTQARLALELFGVPAQLVRNPIALDPVPMPGHADRFALWIGKSDGVKRPDLLCSLARAAPEVAFLMVMNRSDPAVFDRVAGSLPSNVRLVERLAPDEVERLFREASMLVNTSEFEGFPNAFLQAGKHSVPVLSLRVDPDGYLSSFGCGIAARGSEPELRAALLRLAGDPALRAKLGASHRRYVEAHHRLEDRVAELEAILMDVHSRG